MPEPIPSRPRRKERVGQVVLAKMAKTIVVRVERRFRHSRFRKVVTRYRKFYAHDEQQEAQVGDQVRIQETRPLSKLKCWRLVQIIQRRAGPEPPPPAPAGA